MGIRPDIMVNVEPFGPSQDEVFRLNRILADHPSVQRFLRGTNHLLLSMEFFNPEDIPGNVCSTLPKSSQPTPPSEFQATYYDYTNNRTVRATGSFNNPDSIIAAELDIQPLPSQEEFELAVNIVRDHPELGSLIRGNLLRPYSPMPPLIDTELPDGRIERTIAVGLIPCGILEEEPEEPEIGIQDTLEPLHQIVGVNMIRRDIILYLNNAPPASRVDLRICEPPVDSNQATASQGTLGQVQVTVQQAGIELWSFTAVRPAASTGIEGSGIELRHVKYRGKQVLYRAHVPILNVRYENDTCGPFRDWQYQEGMIEAIGTDVAPGFRLCSAPARTILDSGFDAGNFLGVAIYVEGQEVVLVSEMEAGWYRYISQWRLHADGTIRPRFGFSAVANSCTCNRHIHHAYWRFDFDIRTAGNNVVQEFNNPPIIGNSNLHTKNFEIRRSRAPQFNRQWIISNQLTGEGYTLIPGSNDGTSDSFGVGDVWILRYHSFELDDGQGYTRDVNAARANLDKFVNGESINGQDVVLWYAAHFFHDESNPGEVAKFVGPELKPRNW
ncbi:hypothetical protein RRV45_05445 [Bacillus sp. DTU_2020_1000418_1_SI_GHA_SEK_038]|uniref:copper amine oxidase n=1 Tax=Bacillus sp. DTU_2020_1000418_1_SI_GHA_SEK_038 TaxID=3077585 RepID=UPI0028E969D0|nr:hypothetical protein [Bacillus sp. DTU_2020_1000418_1_SI_GHA_SEK_038]WNS76455.1 hypothetical protein RRV45_05445 [Bacillus sp. DTU_2020_1000418_1_SI_GHA_SEK_038]